MPEQDPERWVPEPPTESLPLIDPNPGLERSCKFIDNLHEAQRPLPNIRVSGGAGGTDADLTDLQTAGTTIKSVGASLAALSTSIAADVASVTLSADALACPTTAGVVAMTGASLLTGPLSLSTVGAGMAALGNATVAAKDAYELVDTVQRNGIADFFLRGDVKGFAARLGGDVVADAFGFGIASLLGRETPGVDLIPLDGTNTHQLTALVWLLAPNGKFTYAAPDGIHTIDFSHEIAKDPPVDLGAAKAVATTPPARSTANLLAQTDIRLSENEPKDEKDKHGVRLNRLTRPDGSHAWVVVIPGTEDVLHTTPGKHSRDKDTNVAAMTGRQPQVMLAIEEALRRQMRAVGADPAKEPVMLVGHSQGGILAARLSSDPAFRKEFNVKSTLTSGAPIAKIASDDVPTLALEHEEDPTPNLDGEKNPDRANLTTVTRSIRESPRQGACRQTLDGRVAGHGFLLPHQLPAYLETADSVDRDQSASVTRWREESAEFLDAESQETWVVDITRKETQPLP